MALTQDNRHIAIQTPLGKDVLLLEGFSGTEGLSRLFRYDVRLLSEVNHTIAFKDIVGKPVTISVKHAKGTRFINGIVRRFSQGGGDPTLASYRAEVVPTLWMLTQTADCRIFQNKTVPEIIQAILKEKGVTDFELNLSGSPQPREFCVQYRETDFNFICRLMEQEGIFYFFKHADGKHTLVLGNSPGAHPACTPATARFHWTFGATVLNDDVVTEFAMEQQIRSGKFAMTDYNFTMPKTNLLVLASNPSGDAKLDIYDYPGEYQKRDEGERLVRIRIEEEEAGVRIGSGAGGCAQFVAGHTFTLSEFRRNDLNDAYVLLEVSHDATQNGYVSGQGGDHSYQNTFLCMPLATPFRPPRVTPRPVVQGSQTAEVVGVPGEEIFTDPYGRVKVQFHWDREGKRNEQSSCWIRVSQPWAGKGWGSVSIPRIGQEVVVDFLEGDPDQPIIIGRVYNAEQAPPYTLPAGGVVSGIKSNSTKGGGGYNEIALDDTKGKELIRIHGQYRPDRDDRARPHQVGRQRRDDLDRRHPVEDHRWQRNRVCRGQPHRKRLGQREHRRRQETH